MDFDYIPVWEESPEVYYDPVILELELDGMKKENAELKYQCSELDNDNKLLRTELKTKEREKTELHNTYKENTIKLPIFQAKILELKKDVTQLNTENKNLSLANRILKERREEIDKKYKDATDRIRALMITNQQLEKVIAKYKLEKTQENNDKLRTKAENDKKKATDADLKIQFKSFKAQINHHADELRSKDILAAGLARDNTIIATKHENALIKLKDSEKLVKVLEDKIKTMRKDCLESMLKYSSLNNENIHLKTKINESDELTIKNDELKNNERGLQKQINMYKRMYLAEQLDKEKLKEIYNILEKQKTKYIYTGEDITIMKRKLAECMKEKTDLSEKFSNLDCPFYQSKYGKIEDDGPKIRCGTITERQYQNKILALEHKIKSLHLQLDSQEKKQHKYREVVVKSLYDVKRAQTKEKESKVLLEVQKYQIIYDKIEVLAKESKIQKLEIQNNNCDHQCKLLNRQSTLLCRQIRKYHKKIESMNKASMRANKILNNSEQKKEELKNETQQSEKLNEIMQTQLEYKNKCQKLQQLEANKIKYSNEEFQKKINKSQDEINRKKQKIEELTKAIAQLQTDSEFNKKIHSKSMNDAKNEIGKLTNQTKTLTFEIKNLSKLKKENTELTSKLKAVERDLEYLQKKFDNLYNAKEKKINLGRMPKYLHTK